MTDGKIRLQKYLSECGVASRRKSEELIAAGAVKINGRVAQLGDKLDPKHDTVTVKGKRVAGGKKHYYIMLHKPRGFITTMSDEMDRKCVAQLVKDVGERVYPVGRLDRDSEGLLLMTNDGEFANILMHPNDKVEKVYMAKLNGIIKGEQINKLKDGVEIDGQTVKATRVKLKKVNDKSNTCMVQITIHEGKNHQVKKMFESVGFQVEKLKREKVAFFDLKDLQSGEFRKLTPKEIAKVYALEQK